HFVQKTMRETGYEVLEGMDKLKAFMEPGDKLKLLFIDEANLYDPEAFLVFEGLFNEPPTLLVDSHLSALPKGHKLIFAGNFGYFKGRMANHFFERHGHII